MCQVVTEDRQLDNQNLCRVVLIAHITPRRHDENEKYGGQRRPRNLTFIPARVESQVLKIVLQFGLPPVKHPLQRKWLKFGLLVRYNYSQRRETHGDAHLSSSLGRGSRESTGVLVPRPDSRAT